MWHLYNLIQEVTQPSSLISSLNDSQGDHVRAPAIRRVQNVSSTGSTESHRVRLNLTLAVTRVTWSPSTSSSADAPSSSDTSGSPQNATASLQIAGRVSSENPHVKMGAFHTLDLEANRDVRLEKGEGGWDSIALSRVEESCVPGRGAEVGAVVCGEGRVRSGRAQGSTDGVNPSIDRHGDLLSAFGTHDRHPPAS